MANANPAYYLSRVPGGAAYKGCRQVATFNGVSQYVSIPPVTLSGDFEVEFICKLNNTTSDHAIVSADTAGNNFLMFQHKPATGWQYLGYDNSSLNFTAIVTTNVQSGLSVEKVSFSRVGTVVTIRVNDSIIAVDRDWETQR